MSEALYERCLYFAPGRGGTAKINGRIVKLSSVPDLFGLRIVGVQYIPEVGIARLQPYAAGWRDMTFEERQAADEALTKLAHQNDAGGEIA